ncbi:diphosphate--fructose-6-phosphate 1-phosphotransferase [uncultured Anaerococcus sp.]|uniref:diphosphate--fructose-6-phosphate 1-phosphotransferase n=1 Tax=uncultured Anaerococcus sp. TaxID=293428 RepID=UPI00288B1A0E|nr:diphosphate--fructose-6-phosphate 1-phosphotransferase [uncultured Anaerococcus sp.]
MKKLLIIHGGGPTPVLNASLFGAIKAAKRFNIKNILGARNGMQGAVDEDFINLGDISSENLSNLLTTPGTAIGSSRYPMNESEYLNMVKMIEKNGISHILMNGGNGTMDTCGKLKAACDDYGLNIKIMGIPKTVDNDIAVTDHSPGYGSAARYMAQSVQELCADVKSLPIHVVVLEALGRNVGWVTAASSLAEDAGLGPDLIYLPELDFDEDKFLGDVTNLLTKKKGIVVVASEGLHKKDGSPIVEPIFKSGRATYFGDVSSHLANLVVKKLGYKARSEKPGLLGRASIQMQSQVDRQEAEDVGRIACEAVLEGESGKMVAIRRKSNDPYEIEYYLMDVEKAMMHERKVPMEYINAQGNGLNENFKKWCRPLIGVDLPKMIAFN